MTSVLQFPNPKSTQQKIADALLRLQKLNDGGAMTTFAAIVTTADGQVMSLSAGDVPRSPETATEARETSKVC